jgi:hypothetical protein
MISHIPGQGWHISRPINKGYDPGFPMKPDPPQLSPNASEKPIKAHAIDVVAMDIRHYEHIKKFT